jgi:hypothetical protein
VGGISSSEGESALQISIKCRDFLDGFDDGFIEIDLILESGRIDFVGLIMLNKFLIQNIYCFVSRGEQFVFSFLRVGLGFSLLEVSIVEFLVDFNSRNINSSRGGNDVSLVHSSEGNTV